jgi:hypothetical protein
VIAVPTMLVPLHVGAAAGAHIADRQ